MKPTHRMEGGLLYLDLTDCKYSPHLQNTFMSRLAFDQRRGSKAQLGGHIPVTIAVPHRRSAL